MHTCKVCGQEFDSGPKLGGHSRFHDKKFEDLRTEGAQKTHLIRERGHHCEICKTEVWMGQLVPLHLDHKDGNPTNSSRDNLRLICPNCHAQTDTYGGKNIGRPKCSRREKSKYPSYRSEEWVQSQRQ